MIVDKVEKLVNFLASKDEGTGYLSDLEFNRISTMYQSEYLEAKLSLANNSGTFNIDMLSDFKKTTPAQNMSGLIEKPSDYRHFESASHLASNVGAGFLPSPFELLGSDEWNNRRASVLEPPTSRFPAMKIEGDNIHILPTSVSQVNLTYVFNPPDVVWGYDIVNGRKVFMETGGIVESVDFTIGEDEIHNIVYGICKLAGVSFREGDLAQFGMAEENKGLQM